MNTRSLEPLEARRFLSTAPGRELAAEPAGTAIVRGGVFRDANGDGIRQSTEAWQPNIRVYLDYNNNGVRDGDAEPISITNATGGYRFETARAPATIAVRLLLAGTNFVQTRPTNNAARVVTTTIGGNFELESFGVKDKSPVPPAVTVLTGIVYTDKNRDGDRDAGENGRANVSVYIDANNNALRDEGEPLTRTNVEGRYYFEHVSAGEKTIRLLLGGTNLQQTQPVNGAPVHALVLANQVNQAAPFGVAEAPLPPPTTAVISGNVFYDANENAVRDPNEAGRANVRVYIDLDNDKVRDFGEPVVITNSLGQYRFEQAPVSPELRVRLDLQGTPLKQTLPTGNGARVLATVAGQTYVDQNFGVKESAPPPVTTGAIRGRVFNDADRDGVFDDGERGVPMRSIYLDLDHSGTPTLGEPRAVTNLEGRYVFERVPVGTYDVRLIREGMVQTTPPNNGGHVANVVAGGTVEGLFFGVYRVESAAITSLVFGSTAHPTVDAEDEQPRFNTTDLLA